MHTNVLFLSSLCSFQHDFKTYRPSNRYGGCGLDSWAHLWTGRNRHNRQHKGNYVCSHAAANRRRNHRQSEDKIPCCDQGVHFSTDCMQLYVCMYASRLLKKQHRIRLKNSSTKCAPWVMITSMPSGIRSHFCLIFSPLGRLNAQSQNSGCIQ
jgi:hypothetical protein